MHQGRMLLVVIGILGTMIAGCGDASRCKYESDMVECMDALNDALMAAEGSGNLGDVKHPAESANGVIGGMSLADAQRINSMGPDEFMEWRAEFKEKHGSQKTAIASTIAKIRSGAGRLSGDERMILEYIEVAVLRHTISSAPYDKNEHNCNQLVAGMTFLRSE